MASPSRVLLVDDSRIFRAILEEAFVGQSEFEVAGSVWSGAKAIEFIAASPPDLVTLDIEMPGMNGLEVLEGIQRHNAAHPDRFPIGVVVVSAFTKQGAEVTLQALKGGAFDFVPKSTGLAGDAALEYLRKQLLPRLRQCQVRMRSKHRKLGGSGLSPQSQPPPPPAEPFHAKARRTRDFRAIAIGVSTGGPRALAALLPALTARCPLPVFVAQHMPPLFTVALAKDLARACSCRVVEAQDGESVRPKAVYIAPGGRHLLVREAKPSQFVTLVKDPAPEDNYRPSVDVLFRSMAVAYGGDAIAVVLTGMGTDGTEGLGPLKRAGAYAIAQDEATSVVWGMPGSAVAAGLIDELLPLSFIAPAIGALAPAKE